MIREELAGLLIFLLLAGVAAVIFLTLRYQNYDRRKARGSRHVKPVWKPFWMH